MRIKSETSPDAFWLWWQLPFGAFMGHKNFRKAAFFVEMLLRKGRCSSINNSKASHSSYVCNNVISYERIVSLTALWTAITAIIQTNQRKHLLSNSLNRVDLARVDLKAGGLGNLMVFFANRQFGKGLLEKNKGSEDHKGSAQIEMTAEPWSPSPWRIRVPSLTLTRPRDRRRNSFTVPKYD